MRSRHPRWRPASRVRARGAAAPSPPRSRPATATPASATPPCSMRRWRRCTRGRRMPSWTTRRSSMPGFYVLVGNDAYLWQLIRTGDRARAQHYVAWLLGAAGGYALKVVNPGGVEMWKRGHRGRIGLDDPLGSDSLTPRAILDTLCDAAEALRLPHATHIHCNDLGLAGNVATTLATMQALSGRRAHFTHIQFHAYAAAADGRRLSGARDAGGVHQPAPRGQRRRGPGDVRPGHDADRRRRRRVPALQEQRAEVGQQRHRARDRVRHRAARLSREAGGGGAAVGGRARAVPARGRSLARGALDRSSQRRILHGVPGADAAADGPCLPRRVPEARERHAAGRAARLPTASRASTRSTRSRS